MEQLKGIITWISAGGIVAVTALVTWIFTLKVQLKKARNEAINSDTDTTDKSLKVSMELIATTETLLGKVATMAKQVNTLSAELAEVTAELTSYKSQVAAYVKSCTCGAAKSLQ